MPRLRKQGNATQLLVNSKPFLILGGEVLNSSSSSLDHMGPIWKLMNEIHANTVLVPVTWEMLEPEEGKFEFAVVDGLIRDARRHGLHLIPLWMGSWKNGMSSYVPLWVKEDYERFPRVRRKDGTPVEVLSTLAENSWTADARAFAMLMRHLREFDGQDRTVLMVQIENEVGVLKDSRDRSEMANAAFASPVPTQLMEYLQARENDLCPEFRQGWVAAGKRSSGTWEEVFGAGDVADEAFMAWNYAQYVDRIAVAGKAEYPLPMFVNAWLNMEHERPGDYPSGGPEAHLIDLWQAGAPHIDLLAPDIYAENFQERCQLYTRSGNPLFIPEMRGNDAGARNVFYAIGQHDAMGTSPFAIDRVAPDALLARSYDILGQIAPFLLEHAGKNEMTGFVLDTEHPGVKAEMGGYELEITLDSIFGNTATIGYGVVIATGPDQFLGAGSGFRVSFRPRTPGPAYAGIGTVDEGTFRNGQWVQGRRLNGDETDQGCGWRFSSSGMFIERCRVYRYE